MDASNPPSRNLVDRRVPLLCGIALALCAVPVFFAGRAAIASDPDAAIVQVVSAALDRGQAFWRATIGPTWRDARVVLFSGREPTACGEATADTGPFYCPTSEHVYVDVRFLRDVDGDLARAYVIAHELGHHVQWVVARRDGRSVLVGVSGELEADCYAGAWIADERDRGRVDDRDLLSALAEAAEVGDDRVCPTCSREDWQHGSASQRVAAVRRGLDGRTCRLAPFWNVSQ